MAEHKRSRRQRRRRRVRRLLPDPDDIPQIQDDVDVPDICLGGGQK